MPQGRTLNLSKNDVRIIGHALSEIWTCNEEDIPKNEFVARIGTDRDSLKALSDKPPDQFSRAELFILKRVLREACFGFICEFEFRARLYQPREVVCDLLTRLTDYLHVTWAPEYAQPDIKIS